MKPSSSPPGTQPQKLRAIHSDGDPPVEPPDTDDDIIIAVEPPRPRVTPGEYNAQVVWAKMETLFFGARVRFRFQLVEVGPNHDVCLEAFVPLSDRGQSRLSKFARWSRLLAEFSGERWDRVSLRRFHDFLYRVSVRTVKQDGKQHLLAVCNQYEVVQEIVAVVAKLEKSTARKSGC